MNNCGVGGCCGLESVLNPQFFKSLGDGTRLAVLSQLALSCEPQTVGQVATVVPVDLSVVSRHLRQLKDAGIVASQRRGKEVYYRVRYGVVVQTLRAIADAIEECCPPGSDEKFDPTNPS